MYGIDHLLQHSPAGDVTEIFIIRNSFMRKTTCLTCLLLAATLLLHRQTDP